jgi:hypothetical protein
VVGRWMFLRLHCWGCVRPKPDGDWAYVAAFAAGVQHALPCFHPPAAPPPPPALALAGVVAARPVVQQAASFGMLAADEGGISLKVYHATNIAAAVFVPIALLSDSGSGMQNACNWALTGLIPLHGHIGTNWIVSDYVPESSKGTVRKFTLVASLLTFLGLVRVNVKGDGVIDTVKHLFAPPAVKEEAPAAPAAH